LQLLSAKGGFVVSVSAASYDSLRALCRKNNPAPDDWRRVLLLDGVMRWFADFRGFGGDGLAWAAAGMARRAGVPDDALRDAGMDEETIRLVRREKVADADAQAPLTAEEQLGCLLVTLDHLSELVIAAAAARPKGSVKGLKVSAVQKKFKDSKCAPEANRMTILQGARRMRWEIGDLTSKTIKAILSCEDEVREAAQEIA
jgi:predicted hydrolase (HD superfamily)